MRSSADRAPAQMTVKVFYRMLCMRTKPNVNKGGEKNVKTGNVIYWTVG